MLIRDGMWMIWKTNQTKTNKKKNKQTNKQKIYREYLRHNIDESCIRQENYSYRFSRYSKQNFYLRYLQLFMDWCYIEYLLKLESCWQNKLFWNETHFCLIYELLNMVLHVVTYHYGAITIYAGVGGGGGNKGDITLTRTAFSLWILG